jgi:hypothetical protein
LADLRTGIIIFWGTDEGKKNVVRLVACSNYMLAASLLMVGKQKPNSEIIEMGMPVI